MPQNEEIVNPTIEHLTEKFQDLLDAGAPITGDAIQLILTQVQMFGLAEIVFSSALLVLSIVASGVAYYSGKRCMHYIQERQETQQFVTGLISIVGVTTFFVSLLNTFSFLYDGLLAYFAPIIWIIQNI